METGGKRNWLIICKIIIIAISVVVQLTFVYFTTVLLENSSIYFIYIFTFISIFVCAGIIYSPKKASYKLSWIFIILILPFAGLIIYSIFRKARFGKDFGKRIIERRKKTVKLFKNDYETLEEITDADVYSQGKLIKMQSGYPIYKNSEVKYLPLGEVYFDCMKEDLLGAEKFIFLEYFIISDSSMYRELMDILIAKANSGIDVRFIYDSFGSSALMPKGFLEECENNNIKCFAFNPLSINIYFYINYRSHRKITVIDGNIGYTGGINIGDEYINKNDRLGHWKDMGIRIAGEAVFSLTAMFLDGWELVTGEVTNYLEYKPLVIPKIENSYVAPFDDAPLDDCTPGENNYMKMIATAKKYVYIMTPYLIIDNEMSSLLSLASRSGVDVKILTPHIPDKKMVFEVTRAHYIELLENGVEVFEYTPGFVHGKMLLADDKVCFIGSINFDFRSLMWNYECGAWVYDEKFVADAKKDYLDSISKSEEYTLEKMAKFPLHQKIIQALFKIASPLL